MSVSFRLLIAAKLGALSFAGATVVAEPADLVILGNGIYTMRTASPWAEGVAVRNGTIVFVGDREGAQSLVGTGTRVIELGARMVLPGFQDSHIHPMSGGMRLLDCRFHGLAWPDEVHARIRDCVAELENGEWLRGVGLAEEIFDGVGPSREQLDALTGGHPAYLRTVDGFNLWVNSRAFVLAGIDASTPDPPYGRIERKADGAPSGTLRQSATGLVYRHVPQPSTDKYREALRRATAIANRFGITSVIDASVDANMLEAYRQADLAKELTVRVVASQRFGGPHGETDIDTILARRDRARGAYLRADAVKIFADGSLSMRSAALLDPYADSPAERGALFLERASLERLIGDLDRSGLQVHVHAVGDRATRVALDAFAVVASVNGIRDRRHQIAHLLLIDPADIPRLARLGVTADFQPIWAQRKDAEAEIAEERLGPGRAQWIVPIGSVFDSGARVVAGSDWPSESMSPLDGIQIAITRQPLDGSEPPYLPQQRVSLPQILRAYTIDGAWLAHQESVNGSIEVGKAADLIVLDRNLFAVRPASIGSVRVVLTLLGGREVYRNAGFDF